MARLDGTVVRYLIGLNIWGSYLNDKLVVIDTGKGERECSKWESYDKECEKV